MSVSPTAQAQNQTPPPATTNPSKYTPMEFTNGYLDCIGSGEPNCMSIAAKVFILAFPLFALLTLTADLFAALANCLCRASEDNITPPVVPGNGHALTIDLTAIPTGTIPPAGASTDPVTTRKIAVHRGVREPNGVAGRTNRLIATPVESRSILGLFTGRDK